MLPQLAKRQFLLSLVLVQYGIEQGGMAGFGQNIRQTLDVLGKVVTAKAAAGRKIVLPDTLVAAHALTYHFNINAQAVSQVGQFVDVTQTQSQHAGDGKFEIGRASCRERV